VFNFVKLQRDVKFNFYFLCLCFSSSLCAGEIPLGEHQTLIFNICNLFKTVKSSSEAEEVSKSLRAVLDLLSKANSESELCSWVESIKDCTNSAEISRKEVLRREKEKPSHISVSSREVIDCLVCLEGMAESSEKFFHCPNSENQHLIHKGCFIQYAKTEKEKFEAKKHGRKSWKNEYVKCPYCSATLNLWGENILKSEVKIDAVSSQASSWSSWFRG
jgi:hypothetical protein